MLSVSQENGFISCSLFQLWMMEIFIPFIAEKRARTSYKGTAIHILDGSSCDGGNWFLSALQHKQILSVFLPPHTSEQTQPLYLSMFCSPKQFDSAPIRVSTIRRQTSHGMKMPMHGSLQPCYASMCRPYTLSARWSNILAGGRESDIGRQPRT
jgi:hypothetical protein